MDLIANALLLVSVLVDNFSVDHKGRDDKNGLTLLWSVMTAHCLNVFISGCLRDHWTYSMIAKLNVALKFVIYLSLYFIT